MQSTEPSAFNPLPYYWGTHVMNALTADTFICPYPSLTFQMKGIVNHLPTPLTGIAVVDKYHQRGFQLHTSGTEFLDLSHTCADFSACSNRDRFFGDDETLIFPVFGTEDDRNIDLTCTTAWRLGGKACGNKRCFIPSETTLCTLFITVADD